MDKHNISGVGTSGKGTSGVGSTSRKGKSGKGTRVKRRGEGSDTIFGAQISGAEMFCLYYFIMFILLQCLQSPDSLGLVQNVGDMLP